MVNGGIASSVFMPYELIAGWMVASLQVEHVPQHVWGLNTLWATHKQQTSDIHRYSCSVANYKKVSLRRLTRPRRGNWIQDRERCGRVPDGLLEDPTATSIYDSCAGPPKHKREPKSNLSFQLRFVVLLYYINLQRWPLTEGVLMYSVISAHLLYSCLLLFVTDTLQHLQLLLITVQWECNN